MEYIYILFRPQFGIVVVVVVVVVVGYFRPVVCGPWSLDGRANCGLVGQTNKLCVAGSCWWRVGCAVQSRNEGRTYVTTDRYTHTHARYRTARLPPRSIGWPTLDTQTHSGRLGATARYIRSRMDDVSGWLAKWSFLQGHYSRETFFFLVDVVVVVIIN